MLSSQAGFKLGLDSRLVGGLPLVNRILERLHFDRLLRHALPGGGKIETDRTLGVVLRTLILNSRQPVYRHVEWAQQVEPALLGLQPGEAAWLNDDRVGRALARLFDADRSALLTELVVNAVREFDISLDQLHNDSTTLTLTGLYRDANGHAVRGKPTVTIAYGHNKDHRPDLKQLLLVLTVAKDGAVPVHYRAMDGNTADVDTHIDTWDILRKLANRADFLYVADSKLCAKASMDHIDKHGGRFITILPRNRREDAFFRSYIQTHDPACEEAVRRPHPRRQSGPMDIWKVVDAPQPSAEGYRIVWVWNSLMSLEDGESRRSRIEKACAGLDRLQAKLQGSRCRFRLRGKVEEAAAQILLAGDANRWVSAEITERTEPIYRQAQRGRPGEATRYLRRQRLRFSVTARVNTERVLADERSDGMFPLITNCRSMSAPDVLAAYKVQPKLEKRHEQLKTVQELSPVWLKNVDRIEALLFLYFVALLVHALLERELRRGMAKAKIASLPLYPEERDCRAPATERILDLFLPLQRHRLTSHNLPLQIFEPQLTDLQSKIVRLLGIPLSAFQTSG